MLLFQHKCVRAQSRTAHKVRYSISSSHVIWEKWAWSWKIIGARWHIAFVPCCQFNFSQPSSNDILLYVTITHNWANMCVVVCMCVCVFHRSHVCHPYTYSRWAENKDILLVCSKKRPIQTYIIRFHTGLITTHGKRGARKRGKMLFFVSHDYISRFENWIRFMCMPAAAHTILFSRYLIPFADEFFIRQLSWNSFYFGSLTLLRFIYVWLIYAVSLCAMGNSDSYEYCVFRWTVYILDWP